LSPPSDSMLASLVDAETGAVDPSIFTDWDVYKLELERIFDRSWLFVAHASEIPQQGDFVTRRMGSERVIVSRGTDAAIHVMLNACRHRLRPVCSEDAGRANQFTCPYHGWTYTATGELTGVPYFDAYDGFDMGANGLYHAPRVDSYGGLIFASWDEHAPPLIEYLGTLGWAYDMVLGRTASMEVIRPPARVTVPSNWKLGVGSLAGSAHHVAMFPNTSFLETAPPDGHESGSREEPASSYFLTIRQWQPLRPDLTEVWTWQLREWRGPGLVYSQPEVSERLFYDRWHKLITR
jgi:dibenzofuran dioxygenase subunit alpha